MVPAAAEPELAVETAVSQSSEADPVTISNTTPEEEKTSENLEVPTEIIYNNSYRRNYRNSHVTFDQDWKVID